MERSEWLKRMRAKAEALYDDMSPEFWVHFGLYPNETHLIYLRKFLERLAPHSDVLSAACGAGRYDGLLLEAGHSVVGIDQSAGMLARAREHFPEVRYEKMGLQEMDFRKAFDGAICVDALEHVCPEDWPVILQCLHAALKSDGVLYFTVDRGEADEVQAAYERARAQGLPVVYGEVADQVEEASERLAALALAGAFEELAAVSDAAVYHYHPSMEQVRAWLRRAGFVVEEEGSGTWYEHFVVRRR